MEPRDDLPRHGLGLGLETKVHMPADDGLQIRTAHDELVGRAGGGIGGDLQKGKGLLYADANFIFDDVHGAPPKIQSVTGIVYHKISRLSTVNR